MEKVKRISILAVCFMVTLFSLSGCAVWKDLNTPVRKKKTKEQQAISKAKAAEKKVLPDGTVVGLNSYEKRYIDGIDQNFKRQEKRNSRKVFGF